MDILDETVGADYWERRHSRDNANCEVRIYNYQINEWVSKEDTGTESNTEKEKGLASDSFKRACVNWGIGRELYSAPKIVLWGNAEELKYKDFIVKHIAYENNKISELIIVDSEGKEYFKYPETVSLKGSDNTKQNKSTSTSTKTDKLITEAQRKRLFALGNGNNDLVKQTIEKYGYTKTEEIKMSDYEKICDEIQKVN